MDYLYATWVYAVVRVWDSETQVAVYATRPANVRHAMTSVRLWHAYAVDQEPLAEEAEVDVDTRELDPCLEDTFMLLQPRSRGTARSFLRIREEPADFFR